MLSARAFLLAIVLAVFYSTHSYAFVRSSSFRITKYSLSKLNAKVTHKVSFVKDGKEVATITVPEDKTILDAGLDQGVEMPYDCKLGVCLTCPSKILKGTGIQDLDPVSTLDESVVQQGFALNCCLYARSDMVIDLVDEDTLINAQFVKGAKTTY